MRNHSADNRFTHLIILVLVIILLVPVSGESAQRLKISADKHFIVFEDNTPFFYLGDTAWELFHRLNREEADLYLTDRAQKGFNFLLSFLKTISLKWVI